MLLIDFIFFPDCEPCHGTKGRGLNAPSSEAPRSACPSSTPSRAGRLAIYTWAEN